MEYISLGSTCSVAFQMQKLNIRKHAYPFDWTKINKLSNITKMISDNFSYFFDLEIVRNSDKFPYLVNDNFIENKTDKTIQVKNNYDMIFCHDFLFNECGIDSQMNNFTEKYNRRIHRFVNKIMSLEEIVFIRDELKINKLDKKDIIQFCECIADMNPKLNFKFIVIIHNPKNKPIMNMDDVKNVVIVNDTSAYQGWVRESIKRIISDQLK